MAMTMVLAAMHRLVTASNPDDSHILKQRARHLLDGASSLRRGLSRSAACCVLIHA